MTTKCRFCCGEIIHGEYRCGGGYPTMSTMLYTLFGYDHENDEQIKDGIQLRDDNLLVFESSSGEYESLGVRIKYCPMCGVKLRDKDKQGK